MRLEYREQIRIAKFKIWLDKAMYYYNIEIEKCSSCDGTGLNGVQDHIELVNGYEKVTDHAWDGSYCEDCKGIGYINIDDNNIIFKCVRCSGTGMESEAGHLGSYNQECTYCGGTGYVLWIDNLLLQERARI